MPDKSIALCVFCGSSSGHSKLFREAAQALGREAGKRGMTIVYGGGRLGLMGEIADGTIAEGGNVVGIIPSFLQQREVAHAQVNDLRIVDNMHERKKMMFDLADAFVVLPGGIGTLDELIEMLTWRHLGLHNKPIILIDVAHYWDQLTALFGWIVEAGFASASLLEHLTVVDSVEVAFLMLDATFRAE